MSFDYDLLVIGAGSGGLAASKRAASYGAKVAIIEGDLVGGTCVIRGCVPKKLMVYASAFSQLYENAVGYGWEKVEPKFDWGKMIAAVDGEVRRLSQLHIGFLEKAGVELIRGVGQFVDPHTVAVGDRKITADKILIAVGGEAEKIDIPGIEYAITSREMFLLQEQPKRMAIIGGGYIAVEFACIMRGLGSDVSLIIRRDLVLRGFDEDIRTAVQEGMVKKGINIVPETLVRGIEKTPEGLKLTLSGDGEPLVVDAVLCATGRKPNLAGLELERVGVEVHKGANRQVGGAIAVTVDSCTNVPNIYAVGDCTDRVNLTPVAIAEGRAFADTVFGHQPRYISHHNVPSAVFTQPEAASVGMTEGEARAKYGDANIKIYRARFRPMFYSLTGADEKAMLKLIVLGETERVIGVHMVGKDAAEIIQGMAIPVVMGASKKDFDATTAIHPTVAEEFVTMR